MSGSRPITSEDRRQAAERRKLRAAIAAAVGLVVVTALVFGLAPGLHGDQYTVRGNFSSATNLVPGSAVRMAGVDVGKVSTIGRGPGDTSIVTMAIDNAAPAIHTDATMAIEPRLILEGNFYVAIEPGTPGAPQLAKDGLVPLAHTSVPVQLDQVLDVFDVPSRSALTDIIGELARALGDGRSSRAERGVTPGYRGAKDTARQLDGALDEIRGAANAARGSDPGDLGRLIHGSHDFAAELASEPTALSALVADYSRFMGALADEAGPLERTIVELDTMLPEGTRALTALDEALPSVTRLGHALQPAMRAAPKPLDEASAILGQIDQLASERELTGLLQDLRPATRELPSLQREFTSFLPLVGDAAECLSTRVIPALNEVVPDGKHTTGDPAWLDLLHAATGITSSSGGFDGNGSALRAGVTEGSGSVTGYFPGIGSVFGLGPEITGIRPAWPGYDGLPPFRPDAPCLEQPKPDLHAESVSPPSWMKFGPAEPEGGDG